MPVQYRTLTGLKNADPAAERLIYDLVQLSNGLEKQLKALKPTTIIAQPQPLVLQTSGGSGGDTTDAITSLSGDATATGPGAAVLTLATSGVTPGTYGDATNIPIVTVDAKGRATTVTTVPLVDQSWIPLVDGSEPPNFITDGAGVLILVGYP